MKYAWIAQLVEHSHGKGKVKGSNPFPGSDLIIIFHKSMGNRVEGCDARFLISTGNVVSEDVACPGPEYCLWAQAMASDNEETSSQRISGQCTVQQDRLSGLVEES